VVSHSQHSSATELSNRTSCRYVPSEKSTCSSYPNLIRVVLFSFFSIIFYCRLLPTFMFATRLPCRYVRVLTFASPYKSGPYHPSYNTNICRPTHPYSRWSFRYYYEVLVFLLLLTLEYSYIFIAMNFMCESSALLQVGPYY
jgi:hypothetical protein